MFLCSKAFVAGSCAWLVGTMSHGSNNNRARGMRRTERGMTPGQASAVLQHGMDQRPWGKMALAIDLRGRVASPTAMDRRTSKFDCLQAIRKPLSWLKALATTHCFGEAAGREHCLSRGSW